MFSKIIECHASIVRNIFLFFVFVMSDFLYTLKNRGGGTKPSALLPFSVICSDQFAEMYFATIASTVPSAISASSAPLI